MPKGEKARRYVSIATTQGRQQQAERQWTCEILGSVRDADKRLSIVGRKASLLPLAAAPPEGEASSLLQGRSGASVTDKTY